MTQRRSNMSKDLRDIERRPIVVEQVRSNSMEPKQESIKEIKKHLEEAEAWFKCLARHCTHHVDGLGLCHIPLDIHPVEGPIVCGLKNCPLINEEV
jgi:hypothetical protein